LQAGPWHYAGGAGAYNTAASTTGAQFQLSPLGDSVVVAHLVTAEISLARASTAEVFTLKTHSSALHTPGTIDRVTSWFQGNVNLVATSSLTIKALRFAGITGKAGSYIHIKWIGAAEPMALVSSLPAGAPSNGNGEDGETLPTVVTQGEPALYAAPETLAVGSSMSMNLHTPARLGSFYAKK
jgi:hypothetical protein